MRLARRALALLALSAAVLIFSSGCGSSSSSSSGSHAAPVYVSTAPTAATQGAAYSYTLEATDPAGGSVSYALTTAPTGATLSGSTVSWTPTPAQSRTANSFTVTATTSHGGSATQSWTVTPSGTVTITDAITVWGPSGSSTLTPDLAQLYPTAGALVANADGSYELLYNTGFNNGAMTIPNVPGGYYWLSIGGSYYWTSASSIDYGTDQSSSAAPALPAGTTPGNVTVNISGLDTPTSGTMGDSFVSFFSSPTGLNFSEMPQGSSTASWTNQQTSSSRTSTAGLALNFDLTKVTDAIVYQQENTGQTLGGVGGYVMGPSALLSGLSLQNGGASNVMNATLSPSAASLLPLTIDASQWSALFDNASPNTPSLYGSPFALLAEPYVNSGAHATSGMSALPLVTPLAISGPNVWVVTPVPASCASGLFRTTAITYSNCPSGTNLCGNPLPATTSPYTAAPISADTDLGTVSYEDPFPGNWQREFRFCQQYTEPLPDLASSETFAVTLASTTFGGGTTTYTVDETEAISYGYGLYNQVVTAVPTSAVVPLLGAVKSPQINGASLFAPATLPSRTLALSWTAPALGAPYGYRIMVMQYSSATSSLGLTLSTLSGTGRIFYTGRTSLTIPPDFLTPGATYYIDITALMDAKANVETAPRRSGLPTAAANVVSAPITISSSAP